MDSETVTTQKIPYPKNVADGYIALQIINNFNFVKKARLKISSIDTYQETGDGGSFITMFNGKGWYVEETVEQIDVLINMFATRPTR